MHLSTFNAERRILPNSFFIQCKGLHSGRPLRFPIPNCFVCSCDTAEEQEFYFWLCFGLWKGKLIEPHLCGSVIPFIRLQELRQLIQSQAASINKPAYLAAVKQLQQLEKKETLILQQLHLFRQLKVALIRQHMQP